MTVSGTAWTMRVLRRLFASSSLFGADSGKDSSTQFVRVAPTSRRVERLQVAVRNSQCNSECSLTRRWHTAATPEQETESLARDLTGLIHPFKFSHRTSGVQKILSQRETKVLGWRLVEPRQTKKALGLPLDSKNKGRAPFLKSTDIQTRHRGKNEASPRTKLFFEKAA